MARPSEPAPNEAQRGFPRFSVDGVDVMALPSFHLSEIPEEGLSLTCAVHPDDLALSADDAWVAGELSISMTIFMTGQRVDVSGVLTGTFRRQCVRCLKEYEEATELPFAAGYQCDVPIGRHVKPIAKIARNGPERRESRDSAGLGEDEDVYRCVGERLELGDMLREQIILATPMQPTCREDCRGLCPICGQDRNETVCECIESGQKNPFAVLQEFRKEPENRGAGNRERFKLKNPRT